MTCWVQSGCNVGKSKHANSGLKFARSPIKSPSPTLANSRPSNVAKLTRDLPDESSAVVSAAVSLASYQSLSAPENANLDEAGTGGSEAKSNSNDQQSSTANADYFVQSNVEPLDQGSAEAATPPTPGADSLSLQMVLTSVIECYPEIEIAIGEIETARGKALASWGEFDSVFAAHSISQPLGFYQTYRNGAGVTRPLYSGGEVYGTYRIGDGNFEPWYGERETNEGGELKAGFSVPLLKDRNIDKRRAGLRSSQLDVDQAEANVETRLLQFERFATQAYWDWVASGQAVQIQEQLLSLAQQRVRQINIRIEKGDLAQISKIDNDRFIAKRKNGLIKARRGLEKAAIKLSLFIRDASCTPIVANVNQLPANFPDAASISSGKLSADIEFALRSRPELAELAAAREQACVQADYAQNLLLPKLDVKGFAGQDIGGETSSKGDKTPFELQLGVFAEVPIQRREGAGKVQAARGKITQIDAKLRFVSDKIRAEIQDAASAVNAAEDQIQQSRETVRLNEESLKLGRLAFEEGDIDLLALNIYESSVADAQLQLLEAQYKYFSSLAAYQTISRVRAFETLAATR